MKTKARAAALAILTAAALLVAAPLYAEGTASAGTAASAATTPTSMSVPLGRDDLIAIGLARAISVLDASDAYAAASDSAIAANPLMQSGLSLQATYDPLVSAGGLAGTLGATVSPFDWLSLQASASLTGAFSATLNAKPFASGASQSTSASRNLELAAIKLDDARRSLYSSVYQAWAAWAKAGEAAAIAIADRDAKRLKVDDMVLKVDGGLASAADLDGARTDLLEAEKAVLSQQRAVDEAAAALLFAAGIFDTDGVASGRTALADPALPDAEALIAAAQKIIDGAAPPPESVALRTARLQALWKATDAGLAPTWLSGLSLSARGGYSPGSGPGSGASLSLGLSYSLKATDLAGADERAKAREATSAAADLASALAKERSSGRIAVAKLSDSLKVVKLASDRLAQATKDRDAISVRYDAGAASKLDLALAQLSVLRARSDYASTLRDLETGLLAWK